MVRRIEADQGAGRDRPPAGHRANRPGDGRHHSPTAASFASTTAWKRPSRATTASATSTAACLLAHAATAHGVVAVENALGHEQQFDSAHSQFRLHFPRNRRQWA